MKRTISMPGLQTRAAFEPKTYNPEKRTMEVVWSSGAAVKRNSYYDGPWVEELSLDKRHVNLTRLNNGANLVGNHNIYSLDGILGVVERAWVVNPAEARAEVRFSEQDEKQGLIKDIISGVIRNLSVGYIIHKMEKVSEKDGVPTLRAIDWEPYEISMVTVPAETKTGTRAAEKMFDCEILNLERTETKGMKRKLVLDSGETVEFDVDENGVEIEGTRSLLVPASKAPVTAQAEKTAIRSEAEIKAEEKARIVAIKLAVRSAGLDDAIAEKLIENDSSADFARSHVLEELAKRSKETGSNGVRITLGEQDDKQMKLRGIEEAIQVRMGTAKPTDLSVNFRSHNVFDLARSCLELGGEKTSMLQRHQIAQRALLSTSDFPKLLANVANKNLMEAYAEAPNTYGFFTKPKGVNDFKQVNFYGSGSMPSLLEVPEGSEYKRGSLGEVSDTMAIKKFGRILGFTEEMLINDDLGVFADVPAQWGQAVRSLEASLAWAQITSNPACYDGTTLFHADHANIATSGVLSITSIGQAISLLENQTADAAGGETTQYLNLSAKYLIVPPALKSLALQLTSQLNPAVFGNVNPYNYLTVVSDPRLTGVVWYLAADGIGGKGVSHLQLIGREGPQLDERIGFDVDAIEYKVKHYTNFKIRDWRWIVKNVGV